MKKIFHFFTLLFSAVITSSIFGTSLFVSGSFLLLFSLIFQPQNGVAFSTIAIQDSRNLFTKMVAAVYREKMSTTSFLRSFFPENFSMTKEISIEVQRGLEKIAVDVERGTDGNRNTFSKSTEKVFIPPFYWEYLTANEHRLYDVAMGTQDASIFKNLVNETAEDLFKLQQKQERAYELQCAQVLETGVIELNANTNIDFKRKAASLLDKSGTPWTVGTNNPLSDLEQAAKFIRQTGKSQGGTFNVIMGSQAYNAFESNTIVKERADIRNYSMDSLREPQRNQVGGTYQGQVSAGSYKFDIWTYPEYYDNASNVSTPYVNEKKVIVIPQAPKFKTEFAAVPQLLSDKGAAPQKGKYLVQDFIDERATSHEIHIKSAGVAIPVAIDQIVTMQVIA